LALPVLIDHFSSSPRITVTAVPMSFTRLPRRRIRTTPPRSEAW